MAAHDDAHALKLGHTLASPRFDHDDEVKLEHLGYKQVWIGAPAATRRDALWRV